MNAKVKNNNAALHICFDRLVPSDIHPAYAAAQAAAVQHHMREIRARAQTAGLEPGAIIHVARMAVSLSKKWENERQLGTWNPSAARSRM
ncbi:MAG: hypothetical protein ABSF95_02235 [Verrucomicrobiota bacterium]|jgi:hypothetical protein